MTGPMKTRAAGRQVGHPGDFPDVGPSLAPIVEPRASRAPSPSAPRAAPGVLPSAVFFDLDDTLFDHILTARAALRVLRAEEAMFRRRPLAEICAEYSRLLEAVQADVLAGRTTIDAARAARFVRLAEFCGRTVEPAVAAELSRRYRAQYQLARRPVPGAQRLLERLRGRTKIGIITNNQLAEQEEKLAFLGLRHLVDVLVVSEEVGAAKPDARIFRAALDRAGATADDAVMLGDTWATDIVGARSVGLRAIWFNRFGSPHPEPGHVPELTSLRDFRQVERMLAVPSIGGSDPAVAPAEAP
jgi:HAD superfamily hydrolase (TIGR01549 family)